ncbi:MAG: NRDE family protein [Bacteroidota bacterium]|nr:NRDE family protein [Bacteroidota bacterium]
MCTVTYVPIFKNTFSGNFVLTSSRDEKVIRELAQAPVFQYYNGNELCFPKDPKGKGSWLACDKKGTVLCLLNGAFEPHVPLPKYRQSRGLVVMDYFTYSNTQSFLENYNFSEIEPFTLIIIKDLSLEEVIWDGVKAHFRKLKAYMPYIWSSATLYDEESKTKRQNWFESSINNLNGKLFEWNALDFHLNAGDENIENNIRMNRDGQLQTVSISSIRHVDFETNFTYLDLVNDSEYQLKFSVGELVQ